MFAASLASEVTHSLLIHVPGFMLGVGFDEVRIGLITGSAGVAAVLARPVIGRTMDRRSRRMVIRLGTALLALCAVGYSLVDGPGPLLVVVRVAQGVADAMTYTAFFTYVADRVPPARRTQGLAVFGISGLTPIGLGTSLGDVILDAADYRTLFLVAAGFSALAFGLALTLEKTGVHEGATPRGFFHAIRSRPLRAIWWATGLLSLGFTGVFVFLTTYVRTEGLDSVAPFFLSYAGMAVFLRLAFGWVPDRMGPKRLVAPGLLGYATGFGVLALFPNTIGLLMAGLLCGAGHGIAFPVILSLATTRADRVDRGAVTSVFTAILDLGLIAFGPMLGLIITGPGYARMWGVVAIGIAMGAIAFARVDRRSAIEPTRESPPYPVEHGV